MNKKDKANAKYKQNKQGLLSPLQTTAHIMKYYLPPLPFKGREKSRKAKRKRFKLSLLDSVCALSKRSWKEKCWSGSVAV
jgi:hypothetical protein